MQTWKTYLLKCYLELYLSEKIAERFDGRREGRYCLVLDNLEVEFLEVVYC